MIEQRATYSRRTTTAAHVIPMHRIASLESGLRQAARVTGLAGALQSVDCNQLALGLSLRPLFVHQHLDIGLSPVKLLLHREAFFIERPRPEIAHEGQEMRIPKQWNERLQLSAYPGI